MCVHYSVSNELPSKIQVVSLYHVIEEKIIEDVLVSYMNKPLICTVCHTLGHLIGACPEVTRKWDRKEKP